MEQGITLIAILHIFVAIVLVTIVLLQDSKGGGMGGALGGGSSQTIFGATGAANFMVKVTRILAVIFMSTCIFLTYFLSRKTSHSVVDTLPAGAPMAAPAQQAPPPAAAPAAK